MDKDYQKQIKEWRKKGWSIPDLRGSKQDYYFLVCGVSTYIEKEGSCDINEIPVVEGLSALQPIKEYLPFLRGVGLLRKKSDMASLTELGKRFLESPSKEYLADIIHSKYRLFGEVLDLLKAENLTAKELDDRICSKYGLDWANLSNTRKRIVWLEALGLIEEVGNKKWAITEAGLNKLLQWCLVSPEAIESMNEVELEDVVIQEPPAEIEALLQPLQESSELHLKRCTYNIIVPSPNRIDNLREILLFASERVPRSELFQYIENKFSLKPSSVESMMPFLKVSGLLEEVGKSIYISTSAAKAWIETGSDLDFIRILHANMRFVGEMIRTAENDIVRNDLYEEAKSYGLNTEKARVIASFLLEAGLLEEPQYLHLKSTPLGRAFISGLPLMEKEQELDNSVSVDEAIEKNEKGKSVDSLTETIRLLTEASVNPTAEGKGSGVAFEEEIAALFRLMGFSAKRIGGAGDTDVVVKWEDTDGENHTAIVDGKSRQSGTMSHNDISDVAIETHRDKNNADFVAIVAPAFSGDTIRNHARKKSFALITAEELANVARASQRLGLSLQEIALLFQVPNGMSELSDIISEKERKLDIISIVVSRMHEKQELRGGMSPCNMYYSLEEKDASPTLEELLYVFEMLSRPEIGIMRITKDNKDPENKMYSISDGSSRVNRLRAIADAIEKGLPN